LAPLVTMLLNKKKHKPHQTENLFTATSGGAYATLHKSIDKRAATSDLLLMAYALVLPPLDGPHPHIHLALLLTSLWSCLASPPVDPCQQLPSGLLHLDPH
jgi:hypothetical protein